MVDDGLGWVRWVENDSGDLVVVIYSKVGFGGLIIDLFLVEDLYELYFWVRVSVGWCVWRRIMR